MKIYKVSFIDNEANYSTITFPSLVKAKKWIRENREEWEQVFEDVTTITFDKLNKKTLIQYNGIFKEKTSHTCNNT